MKHFTIKLMTVAATLLAFASCSKDDDGPSGKIDLKVQAVAPTTEDKVPDYSQFTVTVSSERDGKTMTESLDASGSATFNLDIGSYGIEIRGKENGKEYFGTTGMAQYGQSTTVSVDVENLSVHYTGNMDGIVLSELFYNGGTYGGTMMHPDQYIVIANNSDREINVSGLALAQASNMNTLPCSDLTSLLPDYVVAANIYQIPAGQNYTLAPGEFTSSLRRRRTTRKATRPIRRKTPAFRSTFRVPISNSPITTQPCPVRPWTIRKFPT